MRDIYLSDDPLVKHVKTHDEIKAFHSFLKRAKDVGHNLNVGVDFVDGSVLLGGTEMSVNQAMCHIKSAQTQYFKERRSERPLQQVSVQPCSVLRLGEVGWPEK